MKYKLILFGEKHGISENFDIYIKYIKEISKRYQTINIFLEIGYSQAIYINKYINDNEIFPFDEYINEYTGTMLGCKEFKNFITELKRYNLEMKEKRINIIGIDVEFNTNISNRVKEILSTDRIKYSVDIANIDTNIQYINSLKNVDDLEFERKREEYLYNNYIKYCTNDEIYLFFLGMYHVNIENVSNDIHSLAQRIYKNRKDILCIEIKYTNTKRLINNSVICINDKYNISKYYLSNEFEGIYINKDNENIGMIIQNNGKAIIQF